MRTKKSKKKIYKRRAATMSEVDSFITIDGLAYKDERLKDFNIKALYTRIKMYINLKPEGSCFATNETLSEYIGKSPAWVQKKITLLKKLKYIYEDSFDGRKRYLKLCKESETQLKITRQPRKNYEADQIVPSIRKYKKIKDISHGTNPMGTLPSKNPPSKIPYTTKQFNLSCRLLNIQSKNYPKLLKEITPNMKINGALEIEKLERIDKFTFDEIKASILWAVDDSFWSRNILSAASIRNKSKNGNTKFRNMFISYTENMENESSQDALNIPPKDKKIIELIQKEYNPFNDHELYTSIPKIRKAYRKLSLVPKELTDLYIFVWEFIKFLKNQEWIDNPHPAIFRGEGPIWDSYIKHLKNNQMII